MTLPFRDDLEAVAPYGAPQLDVPVCLNVNENPYAPAKDLIAAIGQAAQAAASSLNRYPDRDFHELREHLADYLAVESGVRVSPEAVWAANGSNEVMLHILQVFGGPGRSAGTWTPSYSMYEEYARDTFTQWITGTRNDDFSLDFDQVAAVLEQRPSIIFLASPNNPTGTALETGDLVRILDLTKTSGPDGRATIVVVDEAYGEFRRHGVPSALELLSTYEHLIVTRTMSKAFGAAGLRLGYMVASPLILDYIRRVRLPYHLSAVTQAVAIAALQHRTPLVQQVADLKRDRDLLVDELRELGLETAPSDANFVFFGKFANRHAVWKGLLERGILIREVGPDGWLRVSIGTPDENAAFLSALKEVMP